MNALSASGQTINPLRRWPWLCFVFAFATLLAAWTVLFVIAAKHPTPEVPRDGILLSPITVPSGDH